jgi:hypothetical protein
LPSPQTLICGVGAPSFGQERDASLTERHRHGHAGGSVGAVNQSDFLDRRRIIMGEIIHVTKARVVKEPGRGMKTAYLDAFPDTPVPYGIHGGIKKFYKTEPEVERPATLDHLVMAVAG